MLLLRSLKMLKLVYQKWGVFMERNVKPELRKHYQEIYEARKRWQQKINKAICVDPMAWLEAAEAGKIYSRLQRQFCFYNFHELKADV